MSRREFLRSAVGLPLMPVFLAAGCGKPAGVSVPGNVPAGPIPNYTLRAKAFTASPDGRSKEIWGYDNALPGQLIRAKEGDLIRIRVINELAVPTSVHWHGMHQPGTWQMDGVENVSRPPIPAGSEFTYEFRAEPAGTHWYHSHVGVQYGDGLFGPLIIDEKTPIAAYDREEILLINDWFLESGDALLARLVKGMGMDKMKMDKMKMDKEKLPPVKKMEMKDKPDVGDVPFQSGLVNGKGRFAADSKSPLAVVTVKKGETVRLRLINGGSTYALRFQIDGHPVTIIAADGMPVKPVTVDNLVIGIGERYDLLLKADQDGVRWIRAVTLDGKPTLALLRYADAQGELEASPVQWGPLALKSAELRSREPATLAAKPREIEFRLGGTMMPYRWSVNDQYFPKADPVELQKGESVRFVLRNPTMMDHPFHLHGHSFNVLGPLDAMNLTDPVLRDTVNVPAKSDLAIQWVADNPGRWFFHCHIEWHLATGMARVLEIKPFQTAQ